MNQHLHTSEACIELLKKHTKGPAEISPNGFAERAYVDGAGHAYIGWRHAIASSGEYMRTVTIDAVTAGKLLSQDIARAEACVKLLTDVELAQHEFDALVSLVLSAEESDVLFIIGLLNAGNKNGAANHFLRLNPYRDPQHGSRKDFAVFVARRMAERALFIGVPHVQS